MAGAKVKILQVTFDKQGVVRSYYKTITQPSLGRFDALIQEAASRAKKAGLKESAIKAAIRKSRRSAK
ncbi:MAG: hypothetical protein HZA03_10860 [Nitrospinae bacterium]|nr:hypothetical protein [Nitrospinota bacterium]